MKTYFINGIQVHENDFKLYRNKEFKRLKVNCKNFSCLKYLVHDNIIMNDIKFEVKA